MSLTKKKALRCLAELIGYFFGIYNLDEHLLVNNFGKSSVIVDLGAGKGEFPEWILREFPYEYPTCRIILVEPNPALIQELTKKFESQKQVEILEAAVGNKITDNAKFYLSKSFETNSLNRLLDVDKVGEITVRVVTLRDILSQFYLDKIDLLKIDVEGAEWDIFENFSKHDFERISQISVEFHDFLNPSLRRRTERSIARLKGFGYSLVYAGTNYKYGTPYYNCLFYDRKRLKYTTGAKWLRLPKQLSNRVLNTLVINLLIKR